MKKGKIGVVIILFLTILQLGIPTPVKSAYLSDMVVTNTRDHLLVYFSVKDCFTDEMNRAIESGMNTTFTFFVRLYQKRDLWWDRKIADIEIKHSIKFDNLKKIYEIKFSERGNKPILVRNFDEAKKLMSDVVALEVTPLLNLLKGRRYKLRMMAQLDKITLPLYFHYVFFFLSLWDFETDWHTIDFTY